MYLGVDAGGSSTRAVVVDDSGRCLGAGVAGSGNPRSTDPGRVVRALGQAAAQALTSAAASPDTVRAAAVAMAGARSLGAAGDPIATEGLSAAGISAPVAVESDILAMFQSGTWARDGYVVVAGTGAAAVRVADGKVDAVVDGMGWLLGDEGSGFWIGRRVVRAVVADLDGRGPSTSLTALLLTRLGIGSADETGRTPLARLVEHAYGMPPVQLSQFAPLAFEAAGDDVAADIVLAAGSALAHTLGAVLDDPADAPLVLGGSVLHHQPSVAAAVESAFRVGGGGGPVATVGDGLVGTATLALRRGGVDVGAEVFGRIRTSLAALRDGGAS